MPPAPPAKRPESHPHDASTAAIDELSRIFGCGEDVSCEIAARSRTVDYQPRSVLLTYGEPCEDIFIVMKGRARASAVSVDGRTAVVEDFVAGDIIGEASLVAPGESRHEVVAIDLLRASVMLAHAMVALMSNHACVALAVSRRMIARLSEQNRRLAESSTLSAAGRVHAEILRQARASDDLAIRPPPVLSQLALQVQSTRETVSRTISALQRRGIIRRDEDALVVVAEHRLEEMIY